MIEDTRKFSVSVIQDEKQNRVIVCEVLPDGSQTKLFDSLDKISKVYNKKILEQQFAVSKEKVKVHCDEYHAHSALKDCLIPDKSKGGTQADVEICKDYERGLKSN